jgi:hypothetical protein
MSRADGEAAWLATRISPIEAKKEIRMRFRSRRTIAAVAAGLSLLAGGATALAESGSSPSGPPRGASRIGSGVFVTRSIVPRSIVTGSVAVPAGAIAACGPLGREVAPGFPGEQVHLEAAAAYLGLSVDKLAQELQAGKSLADIAAAQGKSVDGLKQALLDAAKADLDRGVANGDLTADQEQQMLNQFRAGLDDLVNGKGAPPIPIGGPPGDAAIGHLLDAAAAYLGLSVDQLTQQLQGGKTLADVATAQGKSVDGLKQALLDAAKADLDRSVADGDLTADQEQQILGQLRSEIDDFVNGKGGLSIHIEGPGPGVVLGGPFKTAADYLGLSVDQLTQELQAGKSLADIATEHGKSVEGLKQALIDAATADLKKAVDDLVDQKGLPGPPCGGKFALGMALPGLGFRVTVAPTR